MGKNHRHKKKLKSEKNKTQLKSTFLPKGLNVTSPNFKTKPIVLPQQLPDQTAQHVTSKNLTFKDILSRIKHHNSSVKFENLQQMREYIVTVSEEQLTGLVTDILEVTCPLYICHEQKIRREAIKLSNDLIGLISEMGVEPHVNRIVSHLCLAMTHISESIREDSLLIFDMLVAQIPELLARRCDKIIKNFILLISDIKLNADSRSMLAMNVNRKRTSLQWRLMVLLRFKRFLKAVLETRDRSCDVKPVEIIEVTSQVIEAPIYYNPFENCVDIYEQNVNVDVWLELCIDDILPLLKDIWIEIQPKMKFTVKSADLYCTVLNEQTADVLSCIISILGYFHELMTTNQNSMSFNKISMEIIWLFYQSFPFSRENSQSVSEMKCLEENLTLCYLFFVFFENSYDKSMVMQTISYLNVCLLNRNYVGQEKSPILLKVLKRFYEINLIQWQKDRTGNLTLFIKNTAKYYVSDNKQVSSIELFTLLCKQVDVLKDDFSLVAQKACKSLICSKIDQNTYKAIRSLVLQGVYEVQMALSELLPEILSNVKIIELEGVVHEELKIYSILILYKYVPLTLANKKCLMEYSRKGQVFRDVVKSIHRSLVR